LVKGTKISSSVNNEAVADYVTRLASQIDVSTQNATLKAENGKVVVAIPAKNGLELDKAEIINQIINALGGKSRKIQLKVNKKLAEVREDNIENLGLKELVSVGTSNFSGSPTNRIHNVTTGAAKFNGAIVKPGEVFSFNTILGPVDASTGFTPELVIKENKTVPEFGGGLCQVSSTAFRAALNAGFPILERANHAYPVTYYYPLGTDATIYLPSPDFKFKNDSAGHILVQTNIVGNILKFEFYGTKKPIRVKFGGQEDALGAVDKVEDVKPNLYDQNWSGEGSVKSLWYRFIYDGEKLVKTDKFNSNYDSPKKYPH
jgi:vancomycin resistance protein YoaR